MALESRKYLYALIFQRKSDSGLGPVIGGDEIDQGGTRPHLLDGDLVPLLPCLWFCLHLPVSPLDFVDLQATELKQREQFDNGHELLILPHDIAEQFLGGLSDERWIPALVVCEDQLARELGLERFLSKFTLGSIPPAQVGADHLSDLWQRLAQSENSVEVERPDGIEFCASLSDGMTRLPLAQLLRQYDHHLEPQWSIEELKFRSGHLHTVLTATAMLEEMNTTPETAEILMPKFIAKLKHSPVQNVIISFPGVAKSDKAVGHSPDLSQWHEVQSGLDFAADMSSADDYVKERSALAVISAHDGVAQSGTVIELRAVPECFWRILHDLEDHYLTARRPKASYVWRCLELLATQAEPLLSDADIYTLLKADRLTVLSNFPFGLLTLPGDTSPICCRVPVIQRSLTPLTRALQMSFSGPATRVFIPKFRVFIAECLAVDDPIRQHSDIGWEVVSQTLNDAGLGVIRVDIRSVAHLQDELRAHQPGVMILSAHGFYTPKANRAGLVIGGKQVTHLDLEHSPPFVVLSACHTTPRGHGVVNPGDLFLRDGTMAVLSTLVPVNVVSNANLMVRLIVYMLEAQNTDSKLNSLADIWHFTQTSNAVHDILDGAPAIRRWGYAQGNGVSPMEAFKNDRSRGRLTKANIYRDSATVLQDLADEDGTGPAFRQWIQTQGFQPESLFYTMLGWPDRLFMRPVDAAVVTQQV